MQPHCPTQPTINPRLLLAEQDANSLAELLQETGYVIQPSLLRDLAHVLRSGLPWLIEGPRGGGKTALAEALAAACNLPVFYLQGMEGLTLADVLYDWDREGQTQWVRQAVTAGSSFQEARAGQWTREFLKLGEALAAYEWAATNDVIPILICDEFDKVSEKLEDMLLQLFARGFAHIPRYGEIGVREQQRWPIVILLSNDQRHDLSSPMRSRCLYSWLAPPTPREEVGILQARCPTVHPLLLRKMIKLMQGIRSLPGILDKPGLRESIALLHALQTTGYTDLTATTLTQHLCFLAKRHLDWENLRKATARLDLMMELPDADIDSWVTALCGGAE
jgi:MoxR-like ATPase